MLKKCYSSVLCLHHLLSRWTDLIKYWKTLVVHGFCSIKQGDSFVLTPDVHTRGHMFKLSHVHLSRGSRRSSISVRCVGVWNVLPWNVVSCGSTLESFKKTLLNHLGGGVFLI